MLVSGTNPLTQRSMTQRVIKCKNFFNALRYFLRYFDIGLILFEFFKSFARSFEHIPVLCVAKTGQAFADGRVVKRAARYAGHTDALQNMHGACFGCRQAKACDVRQHIIGPCGHVWRQADILQDVAEVIALVLIVAGHLAVIRCIKGRHALRQTPLQGRGRADIKQVVDQADGFSQMIRRDDCTQAPPGDGEGLGEARHGDRAIPHPGQGGQADMRCLVVDDVLVDLVRDRQQIVFLTEVRDARQLFAAPNLARRVGWVAKQHRLGLVGQCLFEHLLGERPRRGRQRHIAWRAPSHLEGVDVVTVVWLKQNQLIARIKQCLNHAGEGPGGADGHDDVFVGVGVFKAIEVDGLFGHLLAQRVDAFEGAVDALVCQNRAAGRVEDLLRCGQIADALPEVDAVDAVAFPGHGADF